MAFARTIRALTVLGTTLTISTAALATVESSCPAPCSVPPRSAIFVRDSGVLAANGQITPLTGTLLKGIRKTVLRVDATVTVLSNGSVPSVFLVGSVNDLYYSATHATSCTNVNGFYCTITASLWFDIDTLETQYPGQLIGQSLDIKLVGGNVLFGGAGLVYNATFSAQVVKKK